MSEPQSALAVIDVIELHSEQILALAGVVGVGVGEIEDEPAVQVFHSGALEHASDIGVRQLVGDVPVVFTAFSVPEAHSEDD